MLQKLSEDIAECHMRAAQCRLRAKHALDPEIKQDFLEMDGRWLTMAHNCEFAAQLSDFTYEVRRRLPKR